MQKLLRGNRIRLGLSKIRSSDRNQISLIEPIGANGTIKEITAEARLPGAQVQ